MTIEVDLKEIKTLLSTLNKKLDALIEDKDIYTVEEIKTKSSSS